MNDRIKSHLVDYFSYLLGIDPPAEHHHLLLACMPKSGSTWLRAMLSQLPGFRTVSLVNGWDRREQELSEIQLLLNRRGNYVAQMHLRFSEPTARLIERFSLKTVVLVRNLFDVVPSLRDHLYLRGGRGPIGFLQPEMKNWPPERVDEFIVEMLLPWYFNFLLCWTECDNKLLISYEELLGDPQGVLARICDRYSIPATGPEIEAAVQGAASQNTRLNKAEIGRGSSLPAAIKQRILRMASYYQGVDFSCIGLPPNRATGGRKWAG